MALFSRDDTLPKPLRFIATTAGVLRAFSRTANTRSKDRRTRGRATELGGRGRTAATPSDIPATGWWDIGWRVIGSIQEDRVMLVAAGVTFYALLALFPATADSSLSTAFSRIPRASVNT